MDKLDQFKKWFNDGNRAVDIRMNTVVGEKIFSIWVYDYDLQVGQHVNDVSDINLKGEVEKQEYEEYLRLRAKYENN